MVRDRLFWQAWEYSAFLFVRLFRPYRVHYRFVQNVSIDLVWLGFPKSALHGVLKEAKENGWLVNEISETHIAIENLPLQENFPAWKNGIVNASISQKEKEKT